MTGFEPLILAAKEAAAAGMTTLVADTISEQGGGLLGLLGRKVTQEVRQKIFLASQKYVENYAERHCLLKVLGMRRPVDLEQVYTTVKLLNERGVLQFASLEDLEKAYRDRGSRRFQDYKQTRQPGIDAANEEKFLMVLGSPGSGKSTFLRRVGLEALKGNRGQLQYQKIPVFLELKQFAAGSVDIEKLILKEFEACQFPAARDFTKNALKQGRLLILLDGLDEVPSVHVNSVIMRIRDFVDQHDENRFICSCRTAAYRSTSSFRRFSDVTLADFDLEQIEQYITNWFQSAPYKGARCWEILQKPENKASMELAQTPLLLTFLCLVYDRSQAFPDNRSVLYRKALRILLEEWAAEKSILVDEIYEGLNTEQEEILLAEIASRGFVKDQLFFTKQELVHQIKSFLSGNLISPQNLNGEKVLNAIVVQQGILIERAENAYSFSHLTMQEYLTAQYIVDHHRIESLIQEYLIDRRWREIFLLVSGLMRNGIDELILGMESELKVFSNSSRLKFLLEWANQSITNLDKSVKSSERRALAIYLVLVSIHAAMRDLGNTLSTPLDQSSDWSSAQESSHDLVNTYALGNTLVVAKSLFLAVSSDPKSIYNLENISSNYRPRADIGVSGRAFIRFEININNFAKTIEEMNIINLFDIALMTRSLAKIKNGIPSKQASLEDHRFFIKKMWQEWFYILGFDSTIDITTFSKQEIDIVNNYLYVSELMIRCKEAAVRVSPDTWAGIEDRMLRVID